MKNEFITWLETKTTQNYKKFKQKPKQEPKAKCNDVIEMIRDRKGFYDKQAMRKVGYDPTVTGLADKYMCSRYWEPAKNYYELKYQICNFIGHWGQESVNKDGYPEWIIDISMMWHVGGQLERNIFVFSSVLQDLGALDYSVRIWCSEIYPEYADDWINATDGDGDWLMRVINEHQYNEDNHGVIEHINIPICHIGCKNVKNGIKKRIKESEDFESV